jgi:hypothetical protein
MAAAGEDLGDAAPPISEHPHGADRPGQGNAGDTHSEADHGS